MSHRTGRVQAFIVGAALSVAALVSTSALAQTATTARPAPVSTAVPVTMATLADPTPGSTGAPAQATTAAKAKPKHKKSRLVSTNPQDRTKNDPLPGSTGLTLGPVPRPPLVIGGQAPGCCQGGSATGANAWTTGNATSADWPATSVEPVPYWWTHGEIEVGGRGFTNNPNRDGAAYGNTAGGSVVYLGQQSLAKYYEYSTIAPGMFGGGHVATGSRDGLYQVDLWANNIGYSDQSYLLNASKAGEQYFTAIWDQTPHVYSTSALTPYNGLGTSNLTLPFSTGIGATGAGIIPFLHHTDIGIERDTAAAAYRWTPTDAWDLGADYSHMSRTGSQVAGVVEFNGFMPTQIPAPVNDTTQNFGANGEYAGTSFWGQKYTIKLVYSGSQYQDNMSSYTVQNPYFPTLGSCVKPSGSSSGTANCVSAQMSTPPSNAANGVSGTLAADLPMQSRYVGTIDYTSMTQNSSFTPMTNNPNAVISPFGGVPWNQVNFGFINGNLGDPTSSLNGRIDTLLSNNVLTTKITPDLTSKLDYRYYSFDNETPHIVFPCWVSYDQTGGTYISAGAGKGTVVPSCTPSTPTSTASGFETTIGTLSPAYTKQNGGVAFNWRPSNEWNFNAEYGYERYDYSQTDVNTTNENSGKLSADWKPTIWLTARLTGYFGDRRYDNYSNQQYVVPLQFPTVPGFASTASTSSSWFYAPAYQQFMYDNRQRTKLDFALDVVAFRGVTVTPTFKYQDDDYGINPLNQEGVNDSRSYSTGVDVGYVVTPDLSFGVSYLYEDYNQTLYNYTNTALTTTSSPAGPYAWEAQPGTCAFAPATASTGPYTGPQGNCLLNTSDREHINTLSAVMHYAAIPDKFNLDFRYTISAGIDEQALTGAPPPATANGKTTTPCTNCGPFPNDTTLFQRLDATATYKFDPLWVSQMGWKGDINAKLRYTWERNAVSNWQNNALAPFTPSISSTAIWLAYDNPNYNVQMIAASLIASW